MKIRASAKRKKNIHIDPLIYALYKGEEYVTSGTIAEISSFTGTSIETLYYYLTDFHKKRTSKRRNGCSESRYMVCLGLDSDEGEADERFLDKTFWKNARRKLWKWADA